MKTATHASVAILGLPISRVTMPQAVARIEEMIGSGESHQVATASLDFACNALKDQYLKRIGCECGMVLPEKAMVWLSRLLGNPVNSGVSAVELIPELARVSAARGYGIYLLGATDQTLRRTVEVLGKRHPGVRIVGTASPENQPVHEMDNDDLLEKIEAAQPDILLVALDSPKQEVWIHRHRHRLKVPVSIGVGRALEEVAGDRSAPRFRMSLTAAMDMACMLARLPLAMLANHLQPDERIQGRLKVEVQGTVRIVGTPAKVSGEICRSLIAEARAASAAGQTMVVDMSSTIRIEADGLGGLLEVRRILLSEGLWIWLAGMSNPVRRVLQFADMSDLFRIAASTSEAIRFTSAAPGSRAGGLGQQGVRPRVARAG
jgi:N-acetylglucosaminyldiphosphoundecaprenol N-acetyl-beta-D-mannosaminyltransferase